MSAVSFSRSKPGLVLDHDLEAIGVEGEGHVHEFRGIDVVAVLDGVRPASSTEIENLPRGSLRRTPSAPRCRRELVDEGQQFETAGNGELDDFDVAS